MKLLSLTCLVGALLLSGCATTLGTNNHSTSGADGTEGVWESSGPRYDLLVPDSTLRPITAITAGDGKVAPLFAPTDLWDRIRRGFAMPDLEQNLVQDREQWYTHRPDYMLRMTERSSKYLFHIVEELERRGMPTELALLPYIESAFNPQAVSSAKAAGMWQFMPATGTYFDLKQNIFRDDRRDVLASTRAALDYLQKLHRMFGDWHLALAAYNWGEGSVSKAIARNQKAGLGIRYTDLNMPAETRLYVPKLQAVKNIVANPDAFRTELPLIENHPYFQTVDITRDIDVALIARLAGIKESDFRALNPSFNKPLILAAGTPQILLPWDNAQVFERNLQAYDKGQYASWTVWTVPNTMSVSEAAERTGMTESDLRALNNIPPRMLIKAGSSLMVPRSTTGKDVTEHVADNGHISLTPEIVTRRTVVRAKKRDTVVALAQRYRVSPASVADWNDFKAKTALKPGQEVVLFLPVHIKTHVAAQEKESQSPRHKTDSKKAVIAKDSGKSKDKGKDKGKLASKTKDKAVATAANTKKKEPVRKVAQAEPSSSKTRRH